MHIIEKITKKDFHIRIYPIQSRYSVYKNGTYSTKKADSSRPNDISYWIPLQKLIFIGENFQLDDEYKNKINLFPVIRNNIIIPFRILQTSDVRHFKLPAYIEADQLPVQIYNFPTPSIGVKGNNLRTGEQYFLIEPKYNRSIVSNFKKEFPKAITIIYRSDKISFIHTEILDTTSAIESEKIKHNDLIYQDNILKISLNPIFTARIYIYKKKWEDLNNLATIIFLSILHIKTINEYLSIEFQKQTETGNVDIELPYIVDLFKNLEPFLTLDIVFIKKYLEETTIPSNIINHLKKILLSQKKNIPEDLNNINKVRLFFDDVITILKEKYNK